MRKLLVFFVAGCVCAVCPNVTFAGDYDADERNIAFHVDFLQFGVSAKQPEDQRDKFMALPLGFHASFLNIGQGLLRLGSIGGSLSLSHGKEYVLWPDWEVASDTLLGFSVTSPITVRLKKLGCSESSSHVHAELNLAIVPFYDIMRKSSGVVVGFSISGPF